MFYQSEAVESDVADSSAIHLEAGFCDGAGGRRLLMLEEYLTLKGEDVQACLDYASTA